MHAAPRGEIRFTAPMSFGLLHLAPVLPEFLERHPECRVDLRVSDAYADLIEERFDLAVRIGTLPDSTFVARKFAPIRLAIAASPAYLARHDRPSEPEDLRDHECLNYVGKTDLWTFTRGRRLEVSGRLSISNGDALRSAALSGAGVIYLPTFLIGDDIAAGRLELLLDEHVPQLHSAYAVYPASRHLSPKVRAMIDFLVESFGSRPPWDAYLGDGEAPSAS